MIYPRQTSFFLIAISLLSGLAVSINSAQNSSTPAAVVLKVKGKVSLLLSEASQEGVAAKSGAMILPGVSVKTGDDGLSMLKMLEDNSIVRVGPRSMLTVKPPKGSATNQHNVKVNIGSVFFNITKKMSGKRFDVETPTSVATVKGTRFWVIVGPNGEASVITLEGLLGLLNISTKETHDVREGETGKTFSNTLTVATTDPRDIPEDATDRNLRIKFRDDKGEERELNIDFEDVK